LQRVRVGKGEEIYSDDSVALTVHGRRAWFSIAGGVRRSKWSPAERLHSVWQQPEVMLASTCQSGVQMRMLRPHWPRILDNDFQNSAVLLTPAGVMFSIRSSEPHAGCKPAA
jgi:hypothetical protein